MVKSVGACLTEALVEPIAFLALSALVLVAAVTPALKTCDTFPIFESESLFALKAFLSLIVTNIASLVTIVAFVFLEIKAGLTLVTSLTSGVALEAVVALAIDANKRLLRVLKL